jgi:hypothetical protein
VPLPWLDDDLDCCVGPKVIPVTRMMFRVPVPNAPRDLAEKVESTLLHQVSQIADQVCNGMLVTCAAMPLKNRDGLGGPRNVVGFISVLPLEYMIGGRRTPSFRLARCRLLPQILRLS